MHSGSTCTLEYMCMSYTAKIERLSFNMTYSHGYPSCSFSTIIIIATLRT